MRRRPGGRGPSPLFLGGDRMSVRSVLLAVLGVVALSVLPGTGGLAADPDWSAWREMPVFDGGRIMPVETFARSVVEKICGRESPRLALAEALPGESVQSVDYAGARRIFPGGGPRTFTAAELLFSWLVEPDHWERVPFLAAKHHQLREEILGLPRVGENGGGLNYISPHQFETSEGLRTWRQDLGRRMRQAQAEGKEFQFEGVDKKAAELVEAYNRWRQLVFSPQWLAHPGTHFVVKLNQVMETWTALKEKENIEQFADAREKGGPGDSIDQVATSLEQLVKQAETGRLPLAKVEPAAARLRRSSATMAAWFHKMNEKFAIQPPPGLEGEQLARTLAWANALAARSAELAWQAADLQVALFDNGGSLRLVPALNPFALGKNRTPENNPQPWLSVQALMLGSDETRRDYPRQPVEDVRTAFRAVAGEYLARDREDRPERFAAAMDRFAGKVRELGERIEPLRRELPIREPDDALLAETAYPPPGATRVEVGYNQVQPFLWSWVISMLAVVGFALSFGALRRPMFWAGLVALAGAEASICGGLILRTYITGWAPVTNMFETVVFVALVVAGLGLWFTMVPLLWPGIKDAWRWTAAPLTWEVPSGGDEHRLIAPKTESAARWLLLAPRAVLTCVVFYGLTQIPYAQEPGYIRLLPKIDPGSSWPTLNGWITWATGLGVLVPTMWYVPRLALGALLSLGTIPYSLYRQGAARPLSQVAARKSFAFAGAVVALVASLVAFYAPVFNKDIGPLNPVLRDNFWLTIHVLTITASYGAGALALGLGNVALFHYLFGRYRDPAAPLPELAARGHRPAGNYTAPPDALHRREPAACASLANFTYKATQVAVLLLAAGTILGALWADVAWGRFWGWDAKEVWALISLLAYLVILHGRYAGLFGNFGLAAFSVVGATSILMAWYGVNFVLGTGLHTYGQGAGGLSFVLAFVAADWLFMAAATIRYRLETHSSAADAGASLSANPISASARRRDEARVEVEVVPEA
jgi:ABC-type transport system involved in cytochrome c biogenesis permease subunit